MVRKFYLENEKGQKYDLMDRDNYCFLYEPSGLGYSYSTDYMLLGNTFIENIRTMEKGLISGSLVTRYYDNIKDFIDFVEQAETLKIAYTVPFDKKSPVTYYKDIKIASLEKTEKEVTSGMLITPVTFDCLSLWYEKNEVIYTITKKEREIRWNFRWASRFTSYNSRNIVFNNKGHVEAPISVEMEGYLINPCISVYVNGKETYRLKIPITLQEFEKLLYNTSDNNIYIYKQEKDGTLTSLFKNEYIDVSKNNIFKLPKGVSEVRLTADNEVLNAKLTIMELYKAV